MYCMTFTLALFLCQSYGIGFQCFQLAFHRILAAWPLWLFVIHDIDITGCPKVPCYEDVYCVKWQLSVKYFFACLRNCIVFDLRILIKVVRVPGRHAFRYDDPWLRCWWSTFPDMPPYTLGILHMRGAQTTKATNMLYNLSVAGCVEYKTLTLSWPAEFKCVGK